MKGKTVYIIGAGFSIDAGASLQNNIVEDIFELHKTNRSPYRNDQIEK